MIPVLLVSMAVLLGLFLWSSAESPTEPRVRNENGAKSQLKRKPSSGRQRPSVHFWPYVITLAGTIFGVYLALYLNRFETEAAEKREASERSASESREADRRDKDSRSRASELLAKAGADISELRDEVRTLYWSHAWPGSSPTSISQRLQLAPLQPPRALEVALEDEVVLTLGSVDGYAGLRSTYSQVSTFMRVVNSQRADNTAMRANLDVLGAALSVEAHLVGAERRYIAREWTEGERLAYCNRWTAYEVQGDTTRGTWAQYRLVPVVLRRSAVKTTVGRFPAADILFDSLPARAH